MELREGWKADIALNQQRIYHFQREIEELKEKVSVAEVDIKRVDRAIEELSERLFHWRFGIFDISDDEMTTSEKRHRKHEIIADLNKRIVNKSFKQNRYKNRLHKYTSNIESIKEKIEVCYESIDRSSTLHKNSF